MNAEAKEEGDGSSKSENHALITEEEESPGMELPLERDGTLALSTLSHAFPNAFGLKYRNAETGAFRVLKVDEHDRVYPPSEGWGKTLFVVIFHKTENPKRKMEDLLEPSAFTATKQKRLDQKKCSDLIVLGIPFKTSEAELREYFEQFGEVLVAQVKRDFKTGKSKGFGFIRYSDYESQIKVLSQRHQVDGRWCDVKIPDSKQDKEGLQQSKKVFVGRIPESMTAETLKNYFSTKGEVTDVFIPRPFRSFAFVTFTDPDVAQSLCGEDHIINGCSVYISQAVPKDSGASAAKGGRSSSPGLSPPSAKTLRSQHMGRKEVWHDQLGSPPGHIPNLVSGVPSPYPPGSAQHWSFHPPPTHQRPPPGLGESMSMYLGGPPPPPTIGPPHMAPNGTSNLTTGTNQATLGMGALNLNSLITPAALHAALTSALAGLLPNMGIATVQGSQSAPGTPQTSAMDLTALLGTLQNASTAAQLGTSVGSMAAGGVPWWTMAGSGSPSAAPSAAQGARDTLSGAPSQPARTSGQWQDEEAWHR